jgi:Raf kinase inhibitor-like YbhB/YbcL family protein
MIASPDPPLRGQFNSKRLTSVFILVFALMAAPEGAFPMSFELTSSAFADDQEIPVRYTCEGDDVSPPLAWNQPPAGTRSLALIVDDPDAPDPKTPRMTWVHWVVYGLPAEARSLPEGVAQKALPGAARFGKNGWKRAEYGGPCPPIGRHRYFHKLYALDVELPDLGTPTQFELMNAMEGHVLAQTELVGTYEKHGD